MGGRRDASDYTLQVVTWPRACSAGSVSLAKCMKGRKPAFLLLQRASAAIRSSRCTAPEGPLARRALDGLGILSHGRPKDFCPSFSPAKETPVSHRTP